MSANLDSDLSTLVNQAQTLFASLHSAADLESAKAQFLGKTGSITALMKGLASLSVDEKKSRGADINLAKQSIEAALQTRRHELAERDLQAQLAAEALDVSLPGRSRSAGSLHPVASTIERIEALFASMGFDVADGPEIESDWHSFTALNNPPNHPARSMQDTFYVDLHDAEQLPYNLRPHTSPMQVRYAQAHVRKFTAAAQANTADPAKQAAPMPEIRVIAPGRTYRVDSDATHSPMFHQVEGLWLGESVSFKDLKVVLTQFYRLFFETEQLELRFRPSFFPFTEPSAEVDIQFASGPLAGRWLEVAGSGQVHPQVVRNMGLDPQTHVGFAFGMGADRLAMLRYGVHDLRQFFEGDIRFLGQFA